MPVLGVGLDLVPVARIERLIARHGERALRRLFTPAERQRGGDHAVPALHLAGRLAAKEAAYKALSAAGAAQGIHWQHLEVERLTDGRPAMVLHGPALERFRAMGASRCLLSLTHAGGVAAAVVIIE